MLLFFLFMDVLAHSIWTYFIFHELRLDNIFLAVFFGIFPDIISFGLYLPYLIFNGKFRFSKLKRIEKEHRNAPKWLIPLYNFSHSLPVSIGVFVIASFAFGKVLWFMVPWTIHILIDVPLHTKNYYPTPFLWPFSEYKFHGIKWHSSKFMVINYISIIAISLLMYFGVI
jgi:hypothetical protein